MRWAALVALVGCYDPSSGSSGDAGTGDAGTGTDGAASDAATGTYYLAAVGGSDEASGTSRDAPFATFAKAFTVLAPGDTLILLEGIYAEALVVTRSGEEGRPITIRAEADGEAILDGQGARIPCEVAGGAWLVLAGIHCTNASAETVKVTDAHDVTLSRVTAEGRDIYPAIAIGRSTRISVVDAAAWGPGPTAFLVAASSFVSLVRCYGRYLADDPTSSGIFQVTNSSDCRVEGSLATASNELIAVQGFVILAENGGEARRNTLVGDIGWQLAGSAFVVTATGDDVVEATTLRDVVAIRTGGGLLQVADAALTVQRMTAVALGSGGAVVVRSNGATHGAGYTIGTSVRDSIFASSPKGFDVEALNYITVDHDHNDLFDLQVPYGGKAVMGAAELSTDPAFPIGVYFEGGYLLAPAAFSMSGASEGPLGATLLEADGVRLWPWPLEDRVFRATGTSPTWELNGGLWRSLNGLYL